MENNMKTKHVGYSVMLSALLSAAAVAEDKVVNVYNWAEYLDPQVVEKFQKETGIKVNYDVYDSNEMLEAKLMSGSSGYDVVVPTGFFLERQVKAGIYAEVDRQQLSNYGNLDQNIMNKIASHDPGNKHNVPYAWGTIGLGYNKRMIEERLGELPVDSLDLIFKPEIAAKLADCGIAVLDSPSEIVGIALNYLGIAPNSEKKADLKAASHLISGVRSNYKYFHSSKYLSDLANGDICVVLGYGSDVLMAQSRAQEAGQGVEVDYVIPKEGSLVWFDLLAIPADAPHPQAAHQFLNYILRGENHASISNYALTAVANKAAMPYLLEEVSTNPGIYPTAEVTQKLFPMNAHSAKYDRLLTRAWSNIKTGR
jgi:putrescine transport system substrate-binding protein